MLNLENDREVEKNKLLVRCERNELARNFAKQTTLKSMINHWGKWRVCKMVCGAESIVFLLIALIAAYIGVVVQNDFGAEDSIITVAFLLLSIGTAYFSLQKKKLEFARERMFGEEKRYQFELREELYRYIRETDHKTIDWPTDLEKMTNSYPYWPVYDILEETRVCIRGDHADYLMNRISWTLIEMGNDEERNRLIEAFVNLRIALTESIHKWRTSSRQFHEEVELYEGTGILATKKLSDSAQILAKEIGDLLKITHLDTYRREKEE